MTYLKLWSSTKNFPGWGPNAPQLKINYDSEINASAFGGNTVTINRSLSELISDSPSELAFAIGHELGHIYQQRTRDFRFDGNPEFDADVWGLILSLSSGYDPYGAAGTLAKLAMVSGRAGLLSQFEDQLRPDAHKSFNQRLENVFDTISSACNSNIEMRNLCATYKGIIHPTFPPTAPLNTDPAVLRKPRELPSGLYKMELRRSKVLEDSIGRLVQ